MSQSMGTVGATAIVSREPNRSGNFVCDGTADEVQINAAIAYVAALGGGTVKILQGQFVLAATITTTASVRISGMEDSTFIDGTALAGGVIAITISAVDYVELDHFSINTKGAGGGPCVFIEDGADHFNIHNIKFIDSDAEVIQIEGTSINGGTITNNVFLTGDSALINADMDAVNVWSQFVITDNQMYGAFLRGIHVLDGENGVIANNTISGVRSGIKIEQSNNTSITDNVLSDLLEDGIAISTSTFINIDGNTINTAGERGINLNSTLCTAQNNTITSTTLDGIRVFDSDNLIQNNIIISATTEGIELTVAAHHCVVSGNNISLGGLQAIECAGADCVISDNICFDNGQSAAATYHEIELFADADRCIVSNNHISSPGDSSEDCIHLDDGAIQVSITGNYCYNGMGSGIALTANNDNCLITGNYLSNNDDYGIELTAATCNDNTVKNNTFISNGTLPVLNNGTGTIFHCSSFYCSEADDEHGAVPGKSITNTQTAYVGFDIPMGVHQIMGADLHVIPDANQAAANWDLAADYAATGEAYNTHNETEAAATYNVTLDQNFDIDIFAAGLLVAATANDWGGVSITVAAVGHDVTLCFLHIHWV